MSVTITYTGDATVVPPPRILVPGDATIVGPKRILMEGNATIGRTVWDWYPDWSVQQIEHGQLDDFSYDARVGWKPTTKPKRTLALPFLFTRSEAHEVRTYVARLDGRRKGFWVPTWQTDFELVQNESIAAATITIKNVGLGLKKTFSSQFDRLALITADKQEYYRIMSVEVDGDTEILTLDHPLASDLVARATICCGLLFARLADDNTQYEYIAGDVVRVLFRFVELPQEYGPITTPHEGTKPVYLYRFTRGALTWRYTNWPVNLTIDGEAWLAAEIEHDDSKADVEFTSDPMMLTLTTDDAGHPIRRLLASGLIETSELEIFECDADDLTPDFSAPVYSGEVGETRFQAKGQIDIEILPSARAGNLAGPTVQIQRVCNLNTYDDYCSLDAEDFTTTGTITSISASGPSVDASEFGAKATLEGDPNWFALGKVTCGSETRLCVGQVGDRLYLNAPFQSAAVGAEISALAGDDHRASTCSGKFDNILNFLGFHLIPNSHPQFEALTIPQPKGGKK
jgi:hypothetical protein